MKTFEYRIGFDMEQIALDNFGKAGWELVAVKMGGQFNTFYFKREKESVQPL